MKKSSQTPSIFEKNSWFRVGFIVSAIFVSALPVFAISPYVSWSKSSSFFIITTPEGADLPASATELNFPLLLRLNGSNFNFSQAQADGRDIRFTSMADAPLTYQIEQWDALNQTAAVWIKIPTVIGNARQEVKMFWGKTDAISESNGTNVFNANNGYVSVFHMDNAIDTTGSVTAQSNDTGSGSGVVGKCRTFTGGNGIDFGDSITTLPTGSLPHTTQAWFRGSVTPTVVMGWGKDSGQSKIVFEFNNPPSMRIDTYQSGGTVAARSALALSQWNHVAYTYESGKARIYINGEPDGSTDGGKLMNIRSPAELRIGGFYRNRGFSGEIDEVRISKVTRSANWIKLEYQNQRVQQTLVGNLVQPGSEFTVSPLAVTLLETAATTLNAKAGGAQQVSWIEKKNSVETLLATNQFTLPVVSKRNSRSENYIIQFKAVYATDTRTIDVPVTVIENLPDPIFTLTGPSAWDGRQSIAISANISNIAAMQTKGVGALTYSWKVNGVAVTKQITPGILTLTRAQGNGKLLVTLVVDNGGSKISQTKVITVNQPAADPWVQRIPVAGEKPVNGQFFARDDSGYGKIFYGGSQTGAPDTVFLKVYTTDGNEVLVATYRQALAGVTYSFVAPILAGKTTYKVQYGTTTGGVDTAVGAPVTDLICGDAYIIEGQSNAIAIDNGVPQDVANNSWIRSYGKATGWGNATAKGLDGGVRIGVWGLIFANRLLANYNMPICIINGAYGGTRIDQHRANPADHGSAGSSSTIYADLYNRVVGAKLTHGIRGLLWHQGEANQGADGPDGDNDYKFYQQYFVDISADWKQDFPNILNYYVFQIWPNACGSATTNDQLREVQRTLSRSFSNMRLMSTLGINPGSGCHYQLAGYQRFSDLISPLVEQDHYGTSVNSVFTAPNLVKAYFTTAARNEVGLEFDQNIAWNPGAPGLFFLDNIAGKVVSGSAVGKIIKLQLNAPSSAARINYVQGFDDWQQPNLLYGSNGVAALTFHAAPIGLAVPVNLAGLATSGQVALTWTATPGATSYTIKRSTTTGGPYTVIGTAISAVYQDTTAVNNTTYYYVVSASLGSEQSGDSNQVSATLTAPPSVYMTWAAAPGQGLTGSGVAQNNAPGDDPDSDGIVNLMELTLGGAPVVSSQLIMPVAKLVGANWVFEYDRSDLSVALGAIQEVEYGSDLINWTAIPIPKISNSSVTITKVGNSDHVKVTIPATSAKLFVHLKVALP
jgi:hypothetical protein